MVGGLTQAAEKATDEWAIAADWQTNMEIAGRCKGVQECHAVLSVILRRLKQPEAAVQMRALELLQACMGNSFPMVQAVHSNHTQQQLLALTSSLSDYRVKNKLLNMMRAWAEAFANVPSLFNFKACQRSLEANGTAFPGRDDDSHYSPPEQPQAARIYDARPGCSRRGNAALVRPPCRSSFSCSLCTFSLPYCSNPWNSLITSWSIC